MSDHPVKRRKKLIEVAIPLEAISKASSREKSIRHGHPSTMHLWWSRKPLATARAILFCQLVDDPGSIPEEFRNGEEIERESKATQPLQRTMRTGKHKQCNCLKCGTVGNNKDMAKSLGRQRMGI
jgi:adenine-specific DNA methylase